ncbi:MAG: prolyl oligopeptidase family serine peptidase [Bacteroidota bacterium]
MFLILTVDMVSAQKDSQVSGSFKGSVKRAVESEYLLYLPESYDNRAEIKWPLMVFLHGSGERGKDLEKVKVHGPPKLIEHGKTFPLVVLSPQCPDSTDWDTETLFALITHIASEYKIDETRIYLTGLSMGGWATWDLAMAYPEYFAAIAPVCARVGRNYPSRAADIKTLPVWVFHGAADEVVLINESAKMVKALEECGNKVRFTIYPTAGHDCWTETYNNQELYNWFLSNKKNPEMK